MSSSSSVTKTAEIWITGMLRLFGSVLIRRQRSSPLMSGSFTSMRARWMPASRTIASPSTALAASTTSYPAWVSTRDFT
jgi:hypothetical protein